MAASGGTLRITFSGEIYSYRELAAGLAEPG